MHIKQLWARLRLKQKVIHKIILHKKKLSLKSGVKIPNGPRDKSILKAISTGSWMSHPVATANLVPRENTGKRMLIVIHNSTQLALETG